VALAVLVSASILHGGTEGPAAPATVTPLVLGQRVKRPLTGSRQKDIFQVVLAEGDYLRVVASSPDLGIDVFLRSPAGEPLFAEAMPSGQGDYPIEWVAETAGTYTIDVSGPGRAAAHGSYELALVALQPAGPLEQKRFHARLVQEAGEDALEMRGDALPSAVEKLSEARALARDLEDTAMEARILDRMGRAYRHLGEPDAALEAFERSLDMRKDQGPYLRGETLHDLGLLHMGRGEYQDALRRYLEALPLLEAAHSAGSQAIVLTNVGRLEIFLGRPERAEAPFEQALELMRTEGDPRGEARALLQLGRMQALLQQPEAALARYRESLRLWPRTSDRSREVQSLGELAVLQAQSGEAGALEQALDALERARGLPDRADLANALVCLGQVHEAQGHLDLAFDAYRGALARREELKAPTRADLVRIARVQRARGDLEDARSQLEDAKRQLEAVLVQDEGVQPKVLDPDLRSSYRGAIHEAYDLYVDVLAALDERSPRQGRLAEAFQVSDRSRSRGLMEMLREQQVDVREGVDEALLRRERALQARLNQLGDVLQGSRPWNEAAVRAQLDRTTKELAQVRGEIRERSPRYAALTQPQLPLVSDIQAMLQASSLLVEYHVGEARSHAWVVTRDGLRGFELPKRSELVRLVGILREGFAARSQPPPRGTTPAQWMKHLAAEGAAQEDAARQLAVALLGPVAPGPEVKRLVVIADGPLHYVPFAMLPLPGESTARVIDRYEVVSAPSASAVEVLRREREGRTPPKRRAAILSDPVFDASDARVASPRPRGAAARYPRLAETEPLARALYKDAPASAVVRATGFQASRALAMSPEVGEARTVVFATHGLVDENYPELSGIVLSLVNEKGEAQEGHLRLHDIYNLRLDADLVVLGACETAVGREIRGEGLMGLARGFMYAGASRVLASLWTVDEEATVELIRAFLDAADRRGLAYPAALREAQQRIRERPRWRAPFYWAGFVLQGDWQ
jgi:CHAT domain-containing protein/tetratricopeptide (TPR) repeat protein